jgi:phytoene dehydrogenase-like protein
MFDVVVIGGGLAGLAAAATAAGRDGERRVALLDRQAGGRAATDQVGRFRFNRGAHALTTKGPGRAVLRDLGVVVEGSAPPLRGARIRIGDRVGLAPGGPVSLARTPMLAAGAKVTLARLLAGMRGWRPHELTGISVEGWFDDLGLSGRPRQMAALLVRTATYSADLSAMSADTAAHQVRLAYAGGVDYLHGGWSTLVDGLTATARRRGVELVDRRAGAVVPRPDGALLVEVADGGGPVRARRVVVAVGSPDATARLLPGGAAWGPTGPAARAACLDLGLREVPATPVLLGVDPPIYLSCHAPAAAGLAPPGAATAQLMWYLRPDEDPTPDEARARLEDHARRAGIDPGTAEESRYLHRMVAASALPTPETGGLPGRPAVDGAGVAGVYLAGDWVGPTGYLADASLCSGAAAGRSAVGSLADPVPATAPATAATTGGPAA